MSFTINENRQKAKEKGELKYEGKACARCGHTVRYVRNYHCVQCNYEHHITWKTKNARG